jgi:hypothetical protein
MTDAEIELIKEMIGTQEIHAHIARESGTKENDRLKLQWADKAQARANALRSALATAERERAMKVGGQ